MTRVHAPRDNAWGRVKAEGGLVGVSTRKPTSISDFESVRRICVCKKHGWDTHKVDLLF